MRAGYKRWQRGMRNMDLRNIHTQMDETQRSEMEKFLQQEYERLESKFGSEAVRMTEEEVGEPYPCLVQQFYEKLWVEFLQTN